MTLDVYRGRTCKTTMQQQYTNKAKLSGVFYALKLQ